jgi:hypothetical protein
MKDSGKAAAVSGGVAGGLTLATAVAKYWAASSSNGLRLIGTYLGKFMGPTIMVAALAYQVNMTSCYTVEDTGGMFDSILFDNS